MLTRDLIVFYSKAFAGNSIERAKKLLGKKNTRTHDKIISAFCLGWIICNLLFLVYLIFFSNPVDTSWLSKMGSGIVIYYLFAVLTYILFATSFCIKVFTKFHINYTFIFEVSKQNSITATMFRSVALMFTTAWLTFLTAQIALYQAGFDLAIFTIMLCIVFFFMLFNPCRFLFRESRV